MYDAIGQRLRDVFPVSTGLVVAGLPLPELMVQIDAEATIGAPVQRIRTFGLNQWFGQPIAFQGAMIAAGTRELFIRGQTGAALDGRRSPRRCASVDAALRGGDEIVEAVAAGGLLGRRDDQEALSHGEGVGVDERARAPRRTCRPR